MAPHSNTLAWKIPWIEEPGRQQSMGSPKSQTQLNDFTFLFPFLTCIKISQEAGKVIWYSYLLKNLPQFVVIHTIKDFGIVSKAKVGIFLELSCIFYDPTDVDNLIFGSSTFSRSILNNLEVLGSCQFGTSPCSMSDSNCCILTHIQISQ